jgi:hypothetical protein
MKASPPTILIEDIIGAAGANGRSCIIVKSLALFPSAVMISSPIISLRIGFLATLITWVGSLGRTISPP